MSAVDLAALIVVLVCLVVVAILVFVVQALVSTLRQLRETVDELRAESLPMFDDLRSTVNKAGDELERVDEVMGRVERIVATADVTSRLTQRVITPPLIKTAAVMKGTGRVTMTLLRGRSRKAITVQSARNQKSAKSASQHRKPGRSSKSTRR